MTHLRGGGLARGQCIANPLHARLRPQGIAVQIQFALGASLHVRLVIADTFFGHVFVAYFPSV